MQFTLTQLRYFSAAADAGSIAEGARNCSVSQPSVSSAVSHLEDVLNIQLFIRHHARGLSITPEGRQLLVSAKALLRQAEELSEEAHGLREAPSGDLHLGCFVTFAPIVMPALLRELTQRNGSIRVIPREADLLSLQQGLTRGEFELALTYDLNIQSGVVFEPLVSVPVYAVLHAGHPLASRQMLHLFELASEPLVLLDLPESRNYFLSIFREAGIEPLVAYETRSFEMVRGLVANGYGYSLLHTRAPHDRTLDGSTVVTIPVSEPHRVMRMGLARLEKGRPTRRGQAFADVCRDRLSAILGEPDLVTMEHATGDAVHP